MLKRLRTGKVERLRTWYGHVARQTAEWSGSPVAMSVAVLLVLGWLVSGFIWGMNDTWQLVANTATTIITFLMVFLIQNSQNVNDKALHLKLDRLLAATPEPADNRLIGLEEASPDELEAAREQRLATGK